MSNRTHDETLKEHESGEEMQEKQKDSRFGKWHSRYPTRQAVLEAVRRDFMVLSSAPKEIRGDEEIVLKAIQANEAALGLATKELRENRDFLWKAACLTYRVWKVVPTELHGDRDFFIKGFHGEEKCGWLLQFASEELRNDREVVLAAIRNDPNALSHASLELCGDREIVLAAVSKDGWALRNTPAEIRADREVILVAIRNNPAAVVDASPELLSGDRDIAFEAVRTMGLFHLREVSEELRGDREFMMQAIRNSDALALRYATPDLLGDEEVVTEAVTKDGRILQYASQELLDRSSMVGLALRHLDRRHGIRHLVGLKLNTKLRLVLQVLQQEPPGDLQGREYFEDFESVQRGANQWRRRAFEKVCLLWKLCRGNGVASDQYQTILDFWDANAEFQAASDIEYCAPVLAVFGKHECSFSLAEARLEAVGDPYRDLW